MIQKEADYSEIRSALFFYLLKLGVKNGCELDDYLCSNQKGFFILQ